MFQRDVPPTCDQHFETLDGFIQEQRAAIEFQYLEGVQFQLDKHIDRFKTRGPPEEFRCRELRRAYAACYWCAEDIADSYCTDIDSFCDEDLQRVALNETIDEEGVCEEVGELITLYKEMPATTALCSRAEQYSGTCDIVCQRNVSLNRINYPGRYSPCFTGEYKPNCDPDAPRPVLEEYVNQLLAFLPPGQLEQQACSALETALGSGNQFALEEHAELLSEHNEQCPTVVEFYHQCYWCEPQAEEDEFCSDLASFCDKPPDKVDEEVNATATCIELKDMLLGSEPTLPATRDLCYRAEQSLHQCTELCTMYQPLLRSFFGRPKRYAARNLNFDGSDYLGTTNKPMRRALIWLTRTSALFSFLGSGYIMLDTLSSSEKRKTTFNQLLSAMALFDLCTALAWSVATAAMPLPEAAGYLGAAGIQGTCMAQAFFVQLGFTSVFYSVSLAAYYLLVITRRWRENDLKNIRIYLHGLPLLFGVGLAFGGLPVYDWIDYGCTLPIVTLWSSLVFGVVPLGLSIIYITGIMCFIYGSVRQKSRASARWAFGGGSSQTMEAKVFWQAFFYALSFYICWPILFAVYLWALDIEYQSYVLGCVIAFVAPLQGFLDFFVYTRTKIAPLAATIRTRLSISVRSSNRDGSNSHSGHQGSQTPNLHGGTAVTASQRQKQWDEAMKDSNDAVIRVPSRKPSTIHFATDAQDPKATGD